MPTSRIAELLHAKRRDEIVALVRSRTKGPRGRAADEMTAADPARMGPRRGADPEEGGARSAGSRSAVFRYETPAAGR